MEQRGCRVQATVLSGMLMCTMVAIPVAHANGPVDVQFVGVNSLTYSGADENAVLTTNSTLRQGDYLHLEIPVENVGSNVIYFAIELHKVMGGVGECLDFCTSKQKRPQQKCSYNCSLPSKVGGLNPFDRMLDKSLKCRPLRLQDVS